MSARLRRVLRCESLEHRRLLTGDPIEIPIHAFAQSETQVSGASSGWSAHLNDDAFPDLLSVNTDYSGEQPKSQLEVWLGDGEGRFERSTSVSVFGPVFQAAFGDLNGDNRMDWVVGNYIQRQTFVGSEDGWTSTEPENASRSRGRVDSIELVDVDSDGKLDLVTFLNSGAVDVHNGFGDGSFGESTTYPVAIPAAGPTDINGVVGDLNGDGFVDIVRRNPTVSLAANFSHRDSDIAGILINDGTGKFNDVLAPEILGTPSALRDLNGDGHLDLIANSISISEFHLNTRVRVYLGRGDATFEAVDSQLLSVQAIRFTTGDFNGDGVEDLLFNRQREIHDFLDFDGIVVAIGNGDGTFQPPFVALMQYNSTPNPVGSIAIDSDADGKDEFFIMAHEFQEVVGETASGVLVELRIQRCLA